MKTILIVIFSMLSIVTFAQTIVETVPDLGPYFWKVKVIMKEVDIEGNSFSGARIVTSQPYQYFEIIKIADDSAVISIVAYDNKDSEEAKKYNFKTQEPQAKKTTSLEKLQFTEVEVNKILKSSKEISSKWFKKIEDDGWGSFEIDTNAIKEASESAIVALMQSIPKEKVPSTSSENEVALVDERNYFIVPYSLINQYAIKNTYNPLSFEFGLINFPFKYRFSKSYSSFTGSFNFGAALGFKVKRRSFRNTSLSIITGYSVSSTTLEASEVRRNPGDLAETNNFTAISFSAGPMIENNRVQVGLFVGLDFLGRLNQDRYGWQHQGKPWFSVGFGYTIFSKQEEKASKDKNP